MKCDKCGRDDDSKRYSTGGAQLCLDCAYELRLLHPEDPDYFDGFSKEEIEAHLKK